MERWIIEHCARKLGILRFHEDLNATRGDAVAVVEPCNVLVSHQHFQACLLEPHADQLGLSRVEDGGDNDHIRWCIGIWPVLEDRRNRFFDHDAALTKDCLNRGIRLRLEFWLPLVLRDHPEQLGCRHCCQTSVEVGLLRLVHRPRLLSAEHRS
jgi:hypothetical protein